MVWLATSAALFISLKRKSHTLMHVVPFSQMMDGRLGEKPMTGFSCHCTSEALERPLGISLRNAMKQTGRGNEASILFSTT